MYDLYKHVVRHNPRTQKLLLVMKLTTLMLLLAIMQVSASVTAQKVTLSVRNAPLTTVFQQIRSQTGYDFAYTGKTLEDTKPVTLNVKNEDLKDVLQKIFDGQPIDYSIEDKLVVVSVKEPTLLEKIKAAFTNIEVTGRVLDEQGSPISSATVTVKGTSNATITDANGYFILKNVDSKGTIVISIIGYDKKEIAAASNIGDIRLTVAINKLDAVQVIAYGQTTQRFNVGSISKVTAEDIEEQPITNPLQALEGRVAGLVISQTSGVPGASLTIQIRGQNNINPALGNGINPMDNPLIIIDGVPTAAQNTPLNQINSLAAPPPGYGITSDPYSGISPFNSINPADIESIEVLKDADATSIYGSRGSNGVILITTKKGKAGKTKFSANIWSGASTVTRTVQMMNTQQYLQMRREAFANDGVLPNVTPSSAAYAPDLLAYDTDKYTDWVKYFLGGTSKVVDANTSLSGGDKNTTFLLGAGYHKETYITPGDFADNRVSFNAHLNHSSNNKKLNLEFSVNYSYDQNNSSQGYNLLSAFTLPPDYPAPTDALGNIVWYYKGINLIGNPLAYLKQKYIDQTYNLLSHFQLSYQVSKDLTLRTSLGYNTTTTKENGQSPLSSLNPALGLSNSSQFAHNDLLGWIIEPQLEYKRNLGLGKLDVLVGSTFQENANYSTNISGSNYPDDGLLGSIGAAGTTSATDANSQYKYNAVFGRVNYIWDSKYIINLSGRRDGSSRFGPGKQFGNFGSMGAGWVFSEESFIKNKLPELSYGKLRTSYGTTGNDGIANYKFLSNWGPAGQPYQGTRGYYPLNLFNPDFSWAVNKKFEIGLELGAFKDRILFSVDWFQNRSNNQLTQYSLPIQTGFNNVTENLNGVLVENTGWEFQLSSNNIKTKNFNWITDFNISIPKNRLLSFPGLSTSSYNGLYVVGQSLTVLNKFKSIGVNPTTGVYQFLTGTGTPTYSPVLGTDRYPIGDLDPRFFGGMRNTFSYKEFRLDFFVEFKKQTGLNYRYTSVLFNAPGALVNLPDIYLSHWQNPGDNNTIQRLTSASSSAAYTEENNARNSDLVYSDASYLRLKTTSLSYALPNKYIKKLGVAELRLYINAQNLLTITGYMGDPETHSLIGIPPLKTITGGIQISL